MYAIVDIAGQQFKVEKDQKIFVHRLESEVGSQIDFDKVLLIDNEKSVVVGAPHIEGAMITAKVLDHLKGDKVIVFKKKRRKGYKVKNGHRQFFTQILVEDIIETGGKPRAAAKVKTAGKPVTETTKKDIKQEFEELKSEAATTVVVKNESADEKKVAQNKETVKPTQAKKTTKSEAETEVESKPKSKTVPKKKEEKSSTAEKVTKATPATSKKAAGKANEKDK